MPWRSACVRRHVRDAHEHLTDTTRHAPTRRAGSALLPARPGAIPARTVGGPPEDGPGEFLNKSQGCVR